MEKEIDFLNMDISDGENAISEAMEEASRKLAIHITEMFDRSANARSSTGIEQVWSNAFQAFEGAFAKEKPTDGELGRSRIYVQVTRSKCIAALASIVSAIFQKGEVPYSIEPTPIPDSINMYLETIGVVIADNIDRMKHLIDDQVKEADMRNKLVRAILNLIIYGTACIQSPVTVNRTRTIYDVEVPDGITLPSLEEIMMLPPDQQGEAMAQVRAVIGQYGRFVMNKFLEQGPDIDVVRIWDCFPDPDMKSCDIQEGDWFIHRAIVTKIEFLDRIKAGLYDEHQAHEALEAEAADTDITKGNDPDFDYANSEAKYRILTFTGRLSLKDLRKVLTEDSKVLVEDRDDDDVVEAIVVVSGDRVLSASLNEDLDGLRPFQMCVYESVPDTPWGRGIPQNVSDAQELVNGLTRSFVEAKKLSSTVQTVIKPSDLAPGTDSKFTTRKVWKTANHVDDVRKAIQFYNFPDMTTGTLEAIMSFRQLADDHSGIPRILEGQSAGSAASRHTATEVSQLVSSANLQLENVVRNIDAFFISRIILGFYRWNMEMSDDMNIKGDFNVTARGYESYRVRQELMMKLDQIVFGYGQDPEFRRMLNVEKILRKRLEMDDLQDFMFDSDTIQQIIAMEQQQAEAAAQAEFERQMQLVQQKFENAVLKKAEVLATKEVVLRERAVNDALKEHESAAIIRGVQDEAERGEAQEEDMAFLRSLERLNAGKTGKAKRG